jgi:hypothetical protein
MFANPEDAAEYIDFDLISSLLFPIPTD